MPRRSGTSRASRTESKRVFSRKRCFIVLIIILLSGILAVGLGLTIPAIIAKENRRKTEEYERRITKSLSRYLDNVDDTVDPCEDFYHYACNNYIKKWPEGTAKHTVNDDINEEIVKNTEELLQSDISPTGSDYRNKVRSFYESCMNEDLLNSLDKTPLTTLLDELGGWPITKGPQWHSRASGWIDLTIQMHKKRLLADYMLELSVIPDVYDESSYILLVSQPSSLALPLSVYKFDPIIAAYRQYMRNVADFLDAPPPTLDRDVNDILEFEKNLARMTKDTISSEDYVKMSINRLQMEVSEIDWYHYFNQLPYRVNSTQQILIRGLDYVRRFAKYIENVDMRIISNYLLWRIVSPSGMRYLYKDAADIQADFYRSMGSWSDKTRSSMCAEDTIHFMYLAVNAMYVRKYVPSSLKPGVVNFVDKIKHEFVNVINNLDWMDEASKKTARKKMDTMKAYIAFPDEIYSDHAINEYYKELTIEHDKLLKNVLTIKWFENNQNFLLLREHDKLQWTKHGPVLKVYASYSIKNELTITAPFLQGVRYDPKGLMVTNFGALGSVIGHELFHSIDRIGASYDERGIQNYWWSNFTKSSFGSREKCLIEKYNKFSFPSLNISVNGLKTSAENFADNVGVHIALQAYLNWVKANGQEVIPKSVKNSAMQLFWISYSNNFCSVQNTQMTKGQLLVDNHSPDLFRITGAVSNMPEFAQDFGCHVGSKLSTLPKCPVT